MSGNTTIIAPITTHNKSVDYEKLRPKKNRSSAIRIHYWAVLQFTCILCFWQWIDLQHLLRIHTVSLLNITLHNCFYSFTEPIVNPDTKNCCKKGYISRIGIVPIIICAAFNDLFEILEKSLTCSGFIELISMEINN